MSRNVVEHVEQTLTSAQALLAVRGTVYPPTAPKRAADPASTALAEAGVTLLEADLALRGYLLSADLRRALVRLPDAALKGFGLRLLADVDAATGADRRMRPLFRGFPTRVPADTVELFVNRVLAALLQSSQQPCVLCGTDGTVVALTGCGHLACTGCFAPADHSACPICYRQLAADDPYLAAGDALEDRVTTDRDLVPARLRVLHAGDDLDVDATAALTALLARPASLTGTESAHFDALLAARLAAGGDWSWLPATVPGRATKARFAAALLAHARTCGERDAAEVRGLVEGLVDTATDVLRLVTVLSGGSAELTEKVRFASVARPVRRLLLGALERICRDGGQDRVVDDMVRYAGAWKRLGEALHPFEYASAFPAVAACFAVVRGTSVEMVPVACLHPALTVRGDRVRYASLAGRVEQHLAGGHADLAAELLLARPGELGRRLDHLLRVAHGDRAMTRSVLACLDDAVVSMSTAVLLSALGTVRTHGQVPTRMFFPKGGAARGHVTGDDRAPIAAATVDSAVAALTGELARRAGLLSKVDVAVVDTGLLDVPVPFGARTSSASLVSLPRASVLPLPAATKARLFVHWTESDERVDLDLSVALFDSSWRHVDTCDYTRQRVGDAAVHSGDFTSAPAPHGAAEFLDLDFDALAARGIRWVVASVYSFNSVPFEDMAEAFAGLMMLPDDYDAVTDERAGRRHVFDARAVEQRFDLTGRHKMHVPLLVDVEQRTWMWLDAAAGVSGEVHAVWSSSDTLARTGRAYADLAASRSRVSLGELALLEASARAGVVVLRRSDGSCARLERAAGEDAHVFGARLTAAVSDGNFDGAVPVAGLAFVLSGDVPVTAGGEVFAVWPRALDAARVRLLAAGDVAGRYDEIVSH